MKIKFKAALVPICTNYFFLFIATGFAFPYLGLQMRSLGLSLDDVALVSGLVPFIAFILTPLLGYIGDKLGYKMVMLACLIISTANVASFNFLPSYREHLPKVAIDTSAHHLNSSIGFVANNVVWFGRYSEEGFNCSDASDNTTISISRIECDDEEYQVDLDLDLTDVVNTTRYKCNEVDAFTCKYVLKENVATENVVFCSVIDKDPKNTFKEGSHSLTLWIYFSVLTIYKIVVNAYYNISDAAASTLAKKERSSYSMILLFGHIGALIPQFSVGQLVDHVSFESSYFDCITEQEVLLKDYKSPFFISGGIMILLAIFIFFLLKVDIEKPPQKKAWWKEFKWILNPAALAFYFQMTIYGIYRGGEDTFFFIYATEELSTSTAFVGYMDVCRTAISLVITPFAKPIIEKVGMVNTICLGFFGCTLRGLLFGFPFTSPPYEFLGYGLFDALICLYFIAIIMYIGKIAPPQLTATAISIGATLTFIVGKGLGAIISGIIVNMFDIRIMLIVTGGCGCIFIFIYWIAYHLILKKFEREERKENLNEETNAHQEPKDYSTVSSIYSSHL